MEHIRSVAQQVADLIGSDFAMRELNCHKLFTTLMQNHCHIQDEVVIPYWTVDTTADGNRLISLGSGRLDCLLYFPTIKRPMIVELKCVALGCTRTEEHKQQCLKYMRFFPQKADVVLITFYNNNKFTIREFIYENFLPLINAVPQKT